MKITYKFKPKSVIKIKFGKNKTSVPVDIVLNTIQETIDGAPVLCEK